ncbi:hypothetical protein [Burkholderia lata]|uniref:hypothetical protein n=1 Tax=Burkholderia lata (strain ATCC 17760 / DSM 23089 / LMG 22485 / NCIMB 9086 / R18194 / 383) TaxID=482957 RepID=UPI0020C625C7|nr:hypothetical protein [Burkholderia lata]
MGTEKRKASDEPDLVRSFTSAFAGASGGVDGVWIKYAMYNGSSRISYWPVDQFRALFRCVEHYSGIHFYGSDLQRMSDEPGYGLKLPSGHPVHTMLKARPTLTEHDFRFAQRRFSVASLVFVDLGEVCKIACTFLNNEHRVDLLPAYIAMNLYGSLKASVDLSGLVTASPAGTA